MSKTLQLKVITALQDKLSGPLNKIRGVGSESAKSMKDLRDKLKGLEQTQKQVGQFRDLSKGLSETSVKMKQAQDWVNALATNIKNTTNPTAAMRREFQQATRTAESLKNKHSQQSQELQRLRSSLSGAGVSTKSLSQDEKALRGNIARTTEQLEAQRKKLAQVAQQQRKLGEAREKMQRTQALAGSMATAGAAGLGVGYGVKRLSENLLAPGISYGAQISELQAVTRLEKGDERLDMLKTQARDLGASTAFSATDVAAGQTFLARAGFTPEAIQSSMKDMLELALANGTDLARTADIASNISSAFKIDPEVEGNMARVADVLSAVSARANVDLEMLGDTMKYLGQAEGLNVSLEEAAAMAGLLGNIGIQSSQAGTTMRAMLNRLSAPAKEGAKAMKMLGLEVTDANGDMLKMPAILESVGKATEGMGNAERAAHFKSIFGVEAGSGMAELVKQQGMGALVALIAELDGATGENRRMAATRADNIEGDLKGLHSAWEEVGIGITDLNEGPLRELIQKITGVIRSIGDWMQRNPELVATIAKIVAVVGILAAVGGTLLITMASILGPLAMMRYGMTLLTIKGGGLFSSLWGLGSKAIPFLMAAFKSLTAVIIANPISATIALIAGAAFLIWKYWNPIKGFFTEMWQQIKSAFNDGLGSIFSLLLNWSPAALIYRAFTPILRFFGIDVPEKFSEFAAKIFFVVSRGIGKVSAFLIDWSPAGLLYSVFAEALSYLDIELPKKLSDAGSLLMSSFGSAAKEGALHRWQEIKEAFAGGITGVSALIVNWSPLGLFYSAFSGVLNYLGFELPNKFTEFGSMMMAGLINGIKSMAGSVKSSVVGIGESTMGWFKEKLGIQSPSRIFMGFGENISEGAAIGISNKSPSVLKAVQALTAGALAIGAISPAQASMPNKAAPIIDVATPSIALQPNVRSELPQINLPPAPNVVNTVDVAAPVVHVAVPAIALQPNIRSELPQISLPSVPNVVNKVDVAAPVVHVVVPAINFSLPDLEFENLRFDDRPPITTQQVNQQTSYQQSSQYQSNAGDNIEIHIHAAPGQNSVDIARAVAAELDRREREKRAQRRSALHDY